MEENVAAIDIILTSEELANIEAVVPKDVAFGERYSASLMTSVNR